MDLIAHGEKPEAVVKRHPGPGLMHVVVHRYELDHLEAERDELLAALNATRGAVEALRGMVDLYRDDDGDLAVRTGASEADDAILAALPYLGGQ